MTKIYSPEELNSFSRETLVAVFLSMQDQMDQLNTNMERLIEQIASANNHRYGRSSEKLDVIQVTRRKKKENARQILRIFPWKSFPIPFRQKSCRRSSALLVGNSFWMKSIKESVYSRQSTQLKNTIWPCMPERTT